MRKGQPHCRAAFTFSGPTACPLPYVSVDDKYCFYLANERQRFEEDSVPFCQERNGSVIKVDTAEKNAALLKYIQGKFFSTIFRLSIGKLKITYKVLIIILSKSRQISTFSPFFGRFLLLQLIKQGKWGHSESEKFIFLLQIRVPRGLWPNGQSSQF